MNSQSYSAWRNNFLSAQLPYRVIEPQELISTGENTYIFKGMELAVEPHISSQIDAFIGISSSQSKAVTDTFGSNGIRDLRNYLALSNSVAKAGKLALIANPDTRTIVGATHLKQEAIPAPAFFDFLEMFMNDNGYKPEKFYVSSSMQGGVTVNLMPDNEEYRSFAEGEEFLTNGVWFRWNLGEIEAGNYFMRMVCSNGLMHRVEQKIAYSNALNHTTIAKMLSLPDNNMFRNSNFGKLRENALQAMQTDASLNEVKMANKLLTSLGVEEVEAEEIVPYAQLIDRYTAAGYDMKHTPLAQCRSHINMWELLNRITYFASHNPIWSTEDNRRSALMTESSKLLIRPRDIKRYIDVG